MSQVEGEAEEGKECSHDDAVRAFTDDFYAAVVGCDFKVFHYGYGYVV